MSPDVRSELARRQAELVAALTNAGPPPENFDSDHIVAASESLARKRLRSAQRACPGIASVVGDRFPTEFRVYAATHPLPSQGGPLADARFFVGWMEARETLPDAVRLEAARIDLHYRSTPAGLVSRRGPRLVFRRLAQQRRLAIGVRLPLFVGRWIFIPLP